MKPLVQILLPKKKKEKNKTRKLAIKLLSIVIVSGNAAKLQHCPGQRHCKMQNTIHQQIPEFKLDIG
jgi:hypothetical protein